MNVKLVVLQRDPIVLFTVRALVAVVDGFYVMTDAQLGHWLWFVPDPYGRNLREGDHVAVAALTHPNGDLVTLACRSHFGQSIHAADAILRF